MLSLLVDIAVVVAGAGSSSMDDVTSKTLSCKFSVDSDSDIVGDGDLDSIEKLSYIIVSMAVLIQGSDVNQGYVSLLFLFRVTWLVSNDALCLCRQFRIVESKRTSSNP